MYTIEEWKFYSIVRSSREQAVCHFWDSPKRRGHILDGNNEAVISHHQWSQFNSVQDQYYNPLFGMAGENLRHGDMNHSKIKDLK